MYHLRILERAKRDLGKLAKAIATRILKRLQWLAEHFGSIKPESLSGDLAGLFKLRVGDYRVIYQVLAEEKTIIVHQIGHRREIYRKR